MLGLEAIIGLVFLIYNTLALGGEALIDPYKAKLKDTYTAIVVDIGLEGLTICEFKNLIHTLGMLSW